MLVKVRLPTPLLPPKMPQLPHLPHIPQLPSHMRVSITDVDLTLSALPSSTTILASIVALFVLLSFVRALTIGLREHLAFVRGRKEARLSSGSSGASGAQAVEKMKQEEVVQRPMASWLWGLVQFFPPARLSSAPSVNEKSSSWSRDQSQPQMQQIQHPNPRVNAHTASRRPGGPVYDRPLATLYERDVPVSMAKMIMSRHTFRRPTSRPPPARPATVQIQVQRRVSPPPPPPPAVQVQVIPTPSISGSSAPSSAPSAPTPQTAHTPPPSLPPPPMTVASALHASASSPSNPHLGTPMTGPRPTPRPTTSIVIPARIPKAKSPLFRPISRSPSPPSPASPPPSVSPGSSSPPGPSGVTASEGGMKMSEGETGCGGPERERMVRRPESPERSPERSPTLEELLEMCNAREVV